MKSNTFVMLGASLMLSLSFITGCLIISNERTESAESERMERTTADGKEILTLQETAQLLNLQEEQVTNIIKAENAILSNNGVFIGKRLPYYRIDNEFMFSRTELLGWVRAVAAENRIYQGNKMIR
ncbi:hypothetical protein [Paenibacillus sp. DMB5]|uniref:hypothetical protein n=1 Tax=Paenibacillus sp. DMB5 TaxID=1780103 RepID=UPI00076DB27E|nr:hypothetical protein [Paenibacillus sp. DMB5]KUP24615.1 hypothetical protein AWJ19_20040 [Paenibacillus sp. DMB5]